MSFICDRYRLNDCGRLSDCNLISWLIWRILIEVFRILKTLLTMTRSLQLRACPQTMLDTIDDEGFYKTAISTIVDTYSVLAYRPHGSAWTILASFFLSRKPNISLGTSGEIKVISLATGTKCLPTSRLSNRGELVHDSHAEVLARRCALRWFMEEVHRISSDGSSKSAWITQTSDGKYGLQVGVELNLYVSTVPCTYISYK